MRLRQKKLENQEKTSEMEEIWLMISGEKEIPTWFANWLIQMQDDIAKAIRRKFRYLQIGESQDLAASGYRTVYRKLTKNETEVFSLDHLFGTICEHSINKARNLLRNKRVRRPKKWR